MRTLLLSRLLLCSLLVSLSLGAMDGPSLLSIDAEDTVVEEDSLIGAAAKGDLIRVKTLLISGESETETGEGGNTPLHSAARHGRAAIISLLVARNDLRDCTNIHGETPLHLASAAGHTDAVVQLLQKKSSRNKSPRKSPRVPKSPRWPKSPRGQSRPKSAKKREIISIPLVSSKTSDSLPNESFALPDLREQLRKAASMAANINAGAATLETRTASLLEMARQVRREAEAKPKAHTISLSRLRSSGSKAKDVFSVGEEATPQQEDGQTKSATLRPVFSLKKLGKKKAKPRVQDVFAQETPPADEGIPPRSSPCRRKASQKGTQRGIIRKQKGQAGTEDSGGSVPPLHLRHTDSDGALLSPRSRGRLQISSPLPGTSAFPATELSTTDLSAFLNKKDSKGCTPLHRAALNGHAEVVRTLRDAGALVMVFDEQGRAAIHCAAQEGHTEVVFLLRPGGAKEDKRSPRKKQILRREEPDELLRDKEGKTALHYSAQFGHAGLTTQLLQAGADPMAQDTKELLALHYALQAGHLSCISLLWVVTTKKLVMPDESLLFYVCRNGYHETLKKLEDDDTYKMSDPKGMNVLHHASFGGHREVVELLMQRGDIDLMGTDGQGRTACHCAVDGYLEAEEDDTHGHLNVLQMLLVAEQNLVNCQAKNKKTALHKAANGGAHYLVGVLLLYDAATEIRDDGGCTALHYAAQGIHKEAVELLLTAGADEAAQSDEGKTPLHYAVSGKVLAKEEPVPLEVLSNDEVKKRFEKKELEEEERKRKVALIELLLNEGAESQARDGENETALDQAEEEEVVELLLPRVRREDLRDLLHAATEEARNEVVATILLKEDATVDATKEGGRTPLHTACINGAKKTAILLLVVNADVMAIDTDKRTPLHYATMKGHFGCVRALLLLRGEDYIQGNVLDLKAKDIHGRSALYYALENNHKEVARLLLLESLQRRLRFLRKRKMIVPASLSSQEFMEELYEELYGHTELVKSLLAGEKIASKTTPSELRSMALIHIASLAALPEIVAYLCNKTDCVDLCSGTKRTPLHYATIARSRDGVEVLVRNGADRSLPDGEGLTPLSWVVLNGSLYDIDSLLSCGFPVNPTETERDSYPDKYATPLHAACDIGDQEKVQRLLSFNANLFARSRLGMNPLYRSVIKRHGNLTGFLVRKGASVTHIILSKAVEKDDDGIITILFKALMLRSISRAVESKMEKLSPEELAQLTKRKKMVKPLEVDRPFDEQFQEFCISALSVLEKQPLAALLSKISHPVMKALCTEVVQSLASVSSEKESSALTLIKMGLHEMNWTAAINMWLSQEVRMVQQVRRAQSHVPGLDVYAQSPLSKTPFYRSMDTSTCTEFMKLKANRVARKILSNVVQEGSDEHMLTLLKALIVRSVLQAKVKETEETKKLVKELHTMVRCMRLSPFLALPDWAKTAILSYFEAGGLLVLKKIATCLSTDLPFDEQFQQFCGTALRVFERPFLVELLGKSSFDLVSGLCSGKLVCKSKEKKAVIRRIIQHCGKEEQWLASINRWLLQVEKEEQKILVKSN